MWTRSKPRKKSIGWTPFTRSRIDRLLHLVCKRRSRRSEMDVRSIDLRSDRELALFEFGEIFHDIEIGLWRKDAGFPWLRQNELGSNRCVHRGAGVDVGTVERIR